MKKIAIFAVLAVMFGLLVGCQSGGEGAGNTGPTVENPTEGAAKEGAAGSGPGQAEMAPNVTEEQANANVGSKAGGGN